MARQLRDEYNAQEWVKYEAGTAGSAPPIDLQCSTKNCTGTISNKYTNRVTYNGGPPETRVECDSCGFKGWRIALDLV